MLTNNINFCSLSRMEKKKSNIKSLNKGKKRGLKGFYSPVCACPDVIFDGCDRRTFFYKDLNLFSFLSTSFYNLTLLPTQTWLRKPLFEFKKSECFYITSLYLQKQSKPRAKPQTTKLDLIENCSTEANIAGV